MHVWYVSCLDSSYFHCFVKSKSIFVCFSLEQLEKHICAAVKFVRGFWFIVRSGDQSEHATATVTYSHNLVKVSYDCVHINRFPRTQNVTSGHSFG